MGLNKVLIKELKIEWEPERLFPYFLEGKLPFFLDSGFVHPEIGRYSFMGSNPYRFVKSRGTDVYIEDSDGIIQKKGNPVDIIDEMLQELKCLPVDEKYPPFQNGAVGYLGYDIGWHFEDLPNRAKNDVNLPDSFFAFYDCVLAYDHFEKKCYLFSSGLPLRGDQAVKSAEAKLDKIAMEIKEFLKRNTTTTFNSLSKLKQPELKSHFTKEQYCQVIQKTKEYIAAGDIYQANISQRFETEITVSPWELYCRLRKINPAPFAAYLDVGEGIVVSASPERFIKMDANRIETRPIKGTRPRTEDPQFNEKMRNELWNSEKDRAELVMIIDLERNDLGRVCEFGTVKVEELFRLETYATVFHLVSTITGKLKPGYSFKEVIKSTFPGGSITGAPKIRAMEIIEELEPVKRGIYTGSIGYLNLAGNLDLNIVIRTFIIKGNKAYFQFGGAIVADSDPAMEYQETLDKAKALILALQQANCC